MRPLFRDLVRAGLRVGQCCYHSKKRVNRTGFIVNRQALVPVDALTVHRLIVHRDRYSSVGRAHQVRRPRHVALRVLIQFVRHPARDIPAVAGGLKSVADVIVNVPGTLEVCPSFCSSCLSVKVTDRVPDSAAAGNMDFQLPRVEPLLVGPPIPAFLQEIRLNSGRPSESLPHFFTCKSKKFS
jgi:hypothetical protein